MVHKKHQNRLTVGVCLLVRLDARSMCWKMIVLIGGKIEVVYWRANIRNGQYCKVWHDH